MSNRLEWLKDMVKQAGQMSLDLHHSIQVERKKDHRDLVTIADRRVEEFLTNEILKKYPDHVILGEETEASASVFEPDQDVWIIDPIDGTTIIFMASETTASLSHLPKTEKASWGRCTIRLLEICSALKKMATHRSLQKPITISFPLSANETH